MRAGFHLPAWVGVAAGVLLAGCYAYVPVARPSPGATVRIQVPVRSAADQAGRAPRSISLEGAVLAFGDTLVLETKARRQLGAFRELVELDTLRIEVAALSGIEERRLSKPRTYAFTAAVAAGATALTLAALEAGGGAGGAGPGDEVPQGSVVLNAIVLGALKVLGR